MGWAEFTVAFTAFFLTHSVPLRPRVRAALTQALGPHGFTLAYSALSTLVLYWLLTAAGRAPFVALWTGPDWLRLVPVYTMGPVCVMLAVTVGRPNPLSFGGSGNHRFDPAHPGVTRWARHPLLLALALWAGAHLLANGSLAHALVFGSLGAFALLGMRVIDRRKKRELGEGWAELCGQIRNTPILPRPRHLPSALFKITLGALAYMALLHLHPLLFGVSPIP